jgi:DNA-binding CsgD family transcriptional regulator/PAS domain-containing protein
VPDAEFALTLALIYDVAMAPDRWPDLLRHLAQEFRCHFAGMVSSSPDERVVRGMAVGVDYAEHQAFLRRFHQRNNPVRLASPASFSGQIVESMAIMPRARLERTEMYEAFFKPNDMGEGVRLTIWRGHSGSQTISLMRSWTSGRSDAAEIARAHAIMPHLQRAAQMNRHLRAANLLARSACEALDAVRQPVLLLDRAGRILHANLPAEALLRAGDGLYSGRGELGAATIMATRELKGLIAAAAAKPGTGGTMRLPRPSGGPALVAIAVPVRGIDGFAQPEDPAVLFSVADPARAVDLEPRMLMILFGLTRAEAALAVQMLAGQEVNGIAAASGRSVHTVRNLLARLMDKTETRRQSELVRLLERLPRLPRGD